MSAEKVRVLIPTTNGLVEVLLLTPEDPAIGRSVACIGGTTDTADIAAAYHAFVASPTGAIERLFGHSCYRLDVSGPIDAGASWQLGVLAAHALHAADRLAQENDAADTVLWATGTVRPVDLAVGGVGHVDEKLAQSLPRLAQELRAGRRVLLAVPSENATSVNATVPAEVMSRIAVLAVSDARALCERLGVPLPGIARGAATGSVEARQAPARSSWYGRHNLWAGAAVLLLLAAVITYQVAPQPSLTWPAEPKPSNMPAPRETLVPETIPFIASRDQAAIRAVYMPAAEHKAIALNTGSIGVSLAQPDRKTATEAALATCRHGSGLARDPCEIYAVDSEVVFARGRPLLPPKPWIVADPITARPFVWTDVPLLSDAQRRSAAGYATASSPKALVVSEAPVFIWHGYQASVDDAVRRALERCGTASGSPCTLIAVDDSFVIPIPRTARPVALARVETMNAIAPELRGQLAADLRAAKRGWNVVAVGASGQIGTSFAAKSESEAVSAAMAACGEKDRACRVMVIGPFAVEPLPASQPDVGPLATPVADPEQEERLLAALASATQLDQPMRDAAARYGKAAAHKALALAPSANRLAFDSEFQSAAQAEDMVLEACQLLADKPCVLIALDDTVQPAGEGWQPHDMPRLSYTGPFEPERIPGLPRIGHALARRADIALYRKAAGPKAAAMHGSDGGRLFIVMTAASQREAEVRALSDCRADPARADAPCHLYAVGDGVIFPEHRTAPVTP